MLLFGVLTFAEGNAGGGLPAWVVGLRAHRHSQVEREGALRFSVYGISSTAPRSSRRHACTSSDAPLGILLALPPVQDMSPLLPELSLVSCRGVESLCENAAGLISLDGRKAFRQPVDTA
jgi:hypothetical protein